MGKKALIVLLAITIVACSGAMVLAAEKKAAATKTDTVKTAVPAPAPARANFGMVAGTITAINNADPANVRIDVKNDADGAVKSVTVTPWTNITKVTDVSELKTGEPVRMMTRKVDDKDVAMGIMFGKVKTQPVPATKAPAAAKAKDKK